MKKLSVFLLLVISVLMLRAEGKATSYVTVGDQTYFCKNVKHGLLNMNLIKEDGTIMKVPIKKVDSYSCNGRIFKKLPVICEGTPTKCKAFMECIKSRNGFILYKHREYGECGNLWDNTYKKVHLQVEFYVYKDGKLYLPVNKENAKSILPFFGINVI